MKNKMVKTPEGIVKNILGDRRSKNKKKFDVNTATKEETEEYFLGPDPRKHKDYKYFSGKK
jgi:hypothetical protein